MPSLNEQIYNMPRTYRIFNAKFSMQKMGLSVLSWVRTTYRIHEKKHSPQASGVLKIAESWIIWISRSNVIEREQRNWPDTRNKAQNLAIRIENETKRKI